MQATYRMAQCTVKEILTLFAFQPAGLVNIARNKLNFPWDDIVLLHVGIIQDRDRGDYQQAYEDQKELVQYVF